MLRLKKKRYAGKLIVFEGTDGAGKTTLIEETKRYLSERYGEEKVLLIKQPTDFSRKTKLFQKMMYCEKHNDIDYRAVQLLTTSDRLQHGHEVIEPAVKEGKIILCDRYVYTSLANMSARGYRKERWFYATAKHILKPDVVFLANVSPTIAIERIKSRPEERNRYLDEALLQNVSKEFMRMAKREKFVVLNTGGSIELPLQRIKAELQKKGL